MDVPVKQVPEAAAWALYVPVRMVLLTPFGCPTVLSRHRGCFSGTWSAAECQLFVTWLWSEKEMQISESINGHGLERLSPIIDRRGETEAVSSEHILFRCSLFWPGTRYPSTCASFEKKVGIASFLSLGVLPGRARRLRQSTPRGELRVGVVVKRSIEASQPRPRCSRPARCGAGVGRTAV
jgi:hypothetical protein